MLVCFDFELQLSPRACFLRLMHSTSRHRVSAISGSGFGVQRLLRWHFKLVVFALVDGSAEHWVPYGECEAATPEAQRRQ